MKHVQYYEEYRYSANRECKNGSNTLSSAEYRKCGLSDLVLFPQCLYSNYILPV